MHALIVDEMHAREHCNQQSATTLLSAMRRTILPTSYSKTSMSAESSKHVKTMNGHDADSPLPVTGNDDSNGVDKMPSRSSSPTEGRNNTIKDEQNTVSPLENGSQDAAISETAEPTLRRSASFLSDYSKPDPPASVGAGSDGTTKEEVPRGTDTDDTNEDKPRLDYINIPSLLKEDLEELEEEDMGQESHVARVLADMRASPEDMTDDDDDMTPEEALEDQLLDQSALDVNAQGISSLNNQSPRVYSAPASKQSSPLILVRAEERNEPYGPDGIPFLPLDSYPPPSTTHMLPPLGYMNQAVENQSSYRNTPIRPSVPTGGRRKIRLHLQEDIPQNLLSPRARSGSFLGHIRRRSSRMMFGSDGTLPVPEMEAVESTTTNRGSITVSWFDGTSSGELQEHVRKSVIRKLKMDNVELSYIRVIDETVDPPEEIVLSPHIPDGSTFLLRFSFSIKDTANNGTHTPGSQYSTVRAPISPSAAPSPHPGHDFAGLNDDFAGLNANQLAVLRNQLNALRSPSEKHVGQALKSNGVERRSTPGKDLIEGEGTSRSVPEESKDKKEGDDVDDLKELMDSDDEDMLLQSDDPIEGKLRQVVEMLLTDRQNKKGRKSTQPQEKRQVIFVLANYFVLFLSLIAISAEIQARAPSWASAMEAQLKDVQECAVDQEALFKCVSNGDIAGLIASVLLWLSRSVATKRIFLFGFESTKKLWTAVYESFVTGFCWGVSYIFIRRGMNPDTRHRFIEKYWKDAVYGCLAGFNATFMKQILKNLIPQEAVEDALMKRQLKILDWLPSFHY